MDKMILPVIDDRKLKELLREDFEDCISEVVEATFNYPDNGPSDIYEIGAPMSAELIDNRTGPVYP